MSNSEERIKDIWEELIIKEKLKAILLKWKKVKLIIDKL